MEKRLDMFRTLQALLICYMIITRDMCYMHDMCCMHMKCVAYYTNFTYAYIQNMNMTCNAYAMSTLHILYMTVHARMVHCTVPYVACIHLLTLPYITLHCVTFIQTDIHTHTSTQERTACKHATIAAHSHCMVIHCIPYGIASRIPSHSIARHCMASRSIALHLTHASCV